MPRIETEVRLDFKDVLIRPKRSTLKSRSQVDVHREFRFRNSKRTWSGVPVIAANMDTVGTFEMAVELAKFEFITCVHKHYTPQEWAAFAAKHPDVMPTVAVSAGSSAADIDKITAILKSHPDIRFICLDVANGYSEFFVQAVRNVRAAFPEHTIIAGNVVTGEMVEELLLSGADIIKVGIGPGSVCTTRKQTGVGYPQLSAVLECADAAHGLNGHVISDGGCTCPGDVAKAFGAGADFVMLGGMLAGHDESGGDKIEVNGKAFKRFYGMSSSEAMKKHNGGVAEYRASEGKSVTVPYRGPVANTCKEILGGVRSTCTYVGVLSPIQTNVKKFAVSTNLYFTLTLVNPMNPVFTTVLKDNSNGNSYYGTDNLLKQLAIYSAVGFVGTLIALATMILPFPIFAMKKLRRHMAASPHDIRDILNLIVDSYCFRAKDIKKMDFFKLRLDRLLENAHERLATMESLLSDCWWEELVGLGFCFHFNKTVAKQLVKLYAKLLADLHAMKFAIEAETCHWTHVVLLKKMQTRFYVLQVEANDLLDDISLKIVRSSRNMSSPKFASLEQALERLMVKYTTLYGNLLSADVHTADDVGKTMPLNVFVYSFHVFVISLLEFEDKFNRKNFSARYRVKNFLKLACRSLLQPISYPRRLIIFAFRTTLAIIIGICCATFIFAFSSTAPTAIAMVADDNIGGTYGNTVNRVGGLVAGTVVPSIFSFFVCKISDDYIYNTLNNIVLFVWTVGSMYVWFCGHYMALAGMTSAFMAASVLLDHSCRSSSTSTTMSYASLTQNALGILILMVVEVVIYPRSSRGLLRSNIQQLLTQYRGVFHDVFHHHIAYNRLTSTVAGPLTEEDIETANALLSRNEVKVLKDQLKEALPGLLKTQAKLVDGSTMEPTLWKPPFSTSKYTEVLNVCRELLDRIDVLVDLVEWHENRRNSGKDKPLRRWQQSRIDAECTAAFTAAQEPPSPTSAAVAELVGESSDSIDENPPSSPLPNVSVTSPAVAKIKWEQSLAVVEAGVEEAFETLVTLFGEEFSGSTAEDHAIYLQMKEAFRIADVQRRGVVDASELGLLLEKLMPYSGSQGIEGMEQYVDEFMNLVDKDHDGKISFGEFMQALNEGFRLELEIYDDQPQVPVGEIVTGPNGAQLIHSKSVRLQRKSTLRRNSIESEDPSTPGKKKHVTLVSPPAEDSRPRASSNFVDTSTFDSKTGLDTTKSVPTTSRRNRFRGMSSNSESSAPEALLNVEAFTLTEAAAALKQSYGECLLGYVDDHNKRVTMEDFIVMSCVISACESISENLTRLNTLAAS